jgi:hypothetical protein
MVGLWTLLVDQGRPDAELIFFMMGPNRPYYTIHRRDIIVISKEFLLGRGKGSFTYHTIFK